MIVCDAADYFSVVFLVTLLIYCDYTHHYCELMLMIIYYQSMYHKRILRSLVGDHIFLTIEYSLLDCKREDVDCPERDKKTLLVDFIPLKKLTYITLTFPLLP